MLYGSETWTLYRHHIKLLRTVQQRHLRFILKIEWDDLITNDEVLAHSNSTDIETILIRNQLRWLGHVTRMPSGRPVKSILYSELAEGSRKVGRPFLRYKDTIKDLLKRGCVLDSWNEKVLYRTAWRHLTARICGEIDIARKAANEGRRMRHHARRDKEFHN